MKREKLENPTNKQLADRERSTRKRQVRAKTINVRRLSKTWLSQQKELLPEDPTPHRPKKRSDCANVQRPCIFVSCKHNLYLDVLENGSIKLNFPDLEPDEMDPCFSCALDVAERSPLTLETIAEKVNITRERIRQLETQMLVQLKKKAPQLKEHLEPSREIYRSGATWVWVLK